VLVVAAIGDNKIDRDKGAVKMHQVKLKHGSRLGVALIAAAAVAAVRPAPAATFTWNVATSQGSGYFSVGGNWVDGTAPGSAASADLVFPVYYRASFNPTADQVYSLNSITFNNVTSSASTPVSYAIAGNQLNIGAGGITDYAPQSASIGNPILLTASQTWTLGQSAAVPAGPLVLGGTQNLSNQTLTLISNASSTLTANLIGTGTVITGGSGTLTLNGSSTFSGNLTVSTGNLVVPTGATVSPSYILLNGGGFNVAGGSLNGNVQVGINAGGSVTATIASGSLSGFEFDIGYQTKATVNQTGGTQSSTFLDVGAFTGTAEAGTGTFNLSGGLANTGQLDVGADDAAGVLNQTGGTFNASSAFIGTTHNGSATVSGPSAFNVSGAVTLGSTGGTSKASLTISNGAFVDVNGQMLLNSTNSTLNVSSGFLALSGLSGVAGSSVILKNDSTDSALNFPGNTAATGIFKGSISGTGGVFLYGGAVIEELLGNNTFTGPVTVRGGLLEMATGASTAYQTGGTTLAGTLVLDFGNYGAATLNAGTNGTIIYNTSGITGGILTGSGTHNVSSVTSFNGTNFGSGSTVSLNTSGTTLTNVIVAGTLKLGGGNTGVNGGFNLAGGTVNGTATVNIGSGAATATTTAVISSGTLSGINVLAVGVSSPALLVQNGGALSTNYVEIGAGSTTSAPGTFNLSSGTVNLAGYFDVGLTSPGILNQTGGTVVALAAQIGTASAVNGQVFVSGSTSSFGTYDVVKLGFPGGANLAQLNVSNGASVSAAAELILQSQASSVSISNATLLASALSGVAGSKITLADPSGGTALTLSGGGDTYAGNIGGTGSLLFSGSGTQVLSGTNTFTGNATVTSGKLEMTSGSASTYQASGGTLQFDSATLGTSTVRADGTGTVVFNTTSVTGGNLAGLGTFNVSAVTSFSGTNFSNGTTISTPSGKSLSITNGANFGTVTLNGTTTLYNWSSGGTVNINGPLSIATGNTFNQTGGTVTIAAASTVNVFGTGAINLTGGILENDGTINGPVNVTNGGDLVGTGSFSQITLGFSASNVGNFFPGSSATSPFIFYFPNITIAPASTVAAEVVSGTVNVTGPTQVSVTNGHSLQFSGTFNASGQQVFFNGGTTKLASATFGSLLVSSGIVQLTSPGQLIAGSVSIFPNIASLDIGASSLVTQTALSSVTSYVKTGYNFSGGANWSGTGGITSSLAAADPSHLAAVGVIGNNQSGSPLYSATHLFHGYAPGVNDTLVAYTYFGDANLSGKVDGSDYSLIDAGYASHGSKTGWYYGDFNYDGVIDGSDYALIDNAFNNQQAALPSVELAAVTIQVTAVPEPAAVPEPGSLAGFAILIAGLRRNGARGRDSSGRRSLNCG
jgi:fibronectin-binding autotransporter adhesin